MSVTGCFTARAANPSTTGTTRSFISTSSRSGVTSVARGLVRNVIGDSTWPDIMAPKMILSTL